MQRRFLQVGERRVHYFRAGEGPPAVLIHSSPANARLLFKEIEQLSPDHTVFAFDTPGFGLSDPLPLAQMEVADLADALAETLRTIGMPRCPVFGSHTGAAIALELGARHPDRVTGLVLDGVPAFTGEECARFFGDYFRVLPLSDLGGHYADTWTRFRDQSLWFPWTGRAPEYLNEYDLSPPHSTHLWMQMYFEAAEHYAPAYRAASFYGARALTAADKLTVPTAYCATTTDMLHPHLARLPPLKPEQEIVDIGASYERKRVLIADRFSRYGADGPAPADRDPIGSSAIVSRQFVDGPAGPLHLRFAGDRTNPPLLLFHDAPGSAEQAEPLINALARQYFVVAPDLPGNGESQGFGHAPVLADYAVTAAALLDRLSLAAVVAYGIGFGASAALAFARRHPDRVEAVAVQGMLLPDEAERADMVARYAPPIAIEPDGAHWYRTWLMLRDSQIYFPWYERTLSALRRVPADFSARPLHRWTMDVMRARESYGALIHAALAEDGAADLAALALPLIQVRGSATPLAAYDERLTTLRAPDTIVADAAGLAAAMREMHGTLTSRDIQSARTAVHRV